MGSMLLTSKFMIWFDNFEFLQLPAIIMHPFQISFVRTFDCSI